LVLDVSHPRWALGYVRSPTKVATLLSLDIAGAFDNVSHPRLLHNLRAKGIPEWTVLFIQSFLSDRTTRMILGDYTGPQMAVDTGIPQGSTLSPILFLLFISTLLPLLHKRNVSAGGFVDDTNILIWSDSTALNCRTLE
jgi:retron-type reverse transcriptase